ncbi:MAG TPA: type II secretion system F family protein [Gammaproteobacteria bacterium]|nr:type II secretion system F family protein [Gammaproteobacteria bacterium]
MTTFHYKAVTAAGEVVEGELEADDRARAVAELQAMGRIPIRAEVRGTQRARWWDGRRSVHRRIPAAAVLEWTRALSSLLGSGISLDRSLQIISASAGEQSVRLLAETTQETVRGGAPLSAALEQSPAAFSRFYINMVKAAEAAGSLDVGLERLEQYLERGRASREQLVSALTYPAILLAVTGLSLVLIVSYVVPQFEPLFLGKNVELPWSTAFIFAMAGAIRHYGWLALVLLIASGVVAVRLWRDPTRRIVIDRTLLRVPLFGVLQSLRETSAFCRSLGMLLENGLPLLSAFTIAKETVGNRWLNGALDDAVTAIREGQGLSRPLEAIESFPPVAVQLVQVGEETGRLDKMLVRVADICDRELGTRVARGLSVLEPALIVGMGVVIGGIIASLMAAIVSVNDIPL